MSYEELVERLNEVFRDVFDDDSICVTPETTADDIDGWESLTHISLIDAVEKEFNMRFQMSEVSGMKNVGEMIDIIAQRSDGEKKKKRGLFGRR